MAVPPQQFCVRWNSYHTNLQAVFPRLLLTEQFADVTLACESRQLRCHKLVLSACSAYLERLLLQNPCKHPIVLMRDMRFSEMQALVDFMYKGEVNVTQEELPSLLKSAEALQIRGLCSSDTSSFADPAKPDTKDFTVASEALVAHAQNAASNGPVQTSPQQKSSNASNGPKKRKSEDRSEVKQETVEEDGLYYGELDNDNLEYNEDEDTGKPGSSLGQASESADFAIANVQCQYDSPSDTETDERHGPLRTDDHTYDLRDEPPAFIIQNIHSKSQPLSPPTPFLELSPKIGFVPSTVNVIHVAETRSSSTLSSPPQQAPFMELTPSIGPGYVPASVNVIHVGERPTQQTNQELNVMHRRIRRSEVVLRQAADCVSRGLTFQTVSEQFNIPISTIRFFMARKGILPRRRRGRSTQLKPCNSPEPPFHMQHFKLPDMIALQADGDEDQE